MLVMEIQQTINRKSWFAYLSITYIYARLTICILWLRFHYVTIFTEILHFFLLLLQKKTIVIVSACLDSFHNRLFGLNNEDAFGFRYLINHMFIIVCI